MDIVDSVGTSKYRYWKPFRPLRILRTFVIGLRSAVLIDRNVATRLLLSVVVLSTAIWLNQWFDVAIIAAVTGQMLVAELFNTAIEEICDYMQPNFDQRIGTIKDISAAASGVAILLWMGVMVYEVIRIWTLVG